MEYSIGVENNGGQGVPGGALNASRGPLPAVTQPPTEGTLHAAILRTVNGESGWYVACQNGVADSYYAFDWADADTFGGTTLCPNCVSGGFVDYRIGALPAGLNGTSGPLSPGRTPVAGGSTLHAVSKKTVNSNKGWYTACNGEALVYLDIQWSNVGEFSNCTECATCKSMNLQ